MTQVNVPKKARSAEILRLMTTKVGHLMPFGSRGRKVSSLVLI